MATTTAMFDEIMKQHYVEPTREFFGGQFVIPIKLKPWYADVAAARTARAKSMGELLDEVWA